jgi:hypothetical protein
VSTTPQISLADFPEKLVLRKDAFRWVVLLPLFALSYFPEFDQESTRTSFFYDKTFAGFRWIDLFLILLVLTTVSFRSTRHSWSFPRVILKPALLFSTALVFSIFYGLAHGGLNVFFDWRGIALGAGLVLVFGYWVQTPFALRSAVNVFLVVFTIRAIWILVDYAFGGGVNIIGIRTPIFDGPTLGISGLAVIMAFRFSLEEQRPVPKLGYLFSSFLACFLVLVCFRRTFWLELFISSAILTFRNRRARILGLTAVAAGLVLTVVVVPGVFVKRVKSFNVLESVVEPTAASEFTDTNFDHVNDILDAWDQIQEHPITGLGLGYTYPTLRIRNWKIESWGVHNMPTHVWLRYGIVGLLSYLWYHFRLLGWLRRYNSGADRWVRAFAEVTFAYLTAQFVTSFGFSPWPYGSTQFCIAMAFLLGSVFALQGSQLAPVVFLGNH